MVSTFQMGLQFSRSFYSLTCVSLKQKVPSLLGRYILVLLGATNYFVYMYACSNVIKFARNPFYPLVILCPSHRYYDCEI